MDHGVASLTARSIADGGFISYGPNFSDQFWRAASCVDRILKGEKPADLSVQASIKYNLVVTPTQLRAITRSSSAA